MLRRVCPGGGDVDRGFPAASLAGSGLVRLLRLRGAAGLPAGLRRDGRRAEGAIHSIRHATSRSREVKGRQESSGRDPREKARDTSRATGQGVETCDRRKWHRGMTVAATAASSSSPPGCHCQPLRKRGPAAAHPLQAATTAAGCLASRKKRGIDTARRGHKTQFWRASVVSSEMDVASPNHRLVPGGFAREIGFVCLRVVAVAR